MDGLRPKKIQNNEFIENELKNWVKMSWTTNSMGLNDKNKKINWFNLEKIVIGTIRGSEFLYISHKLITNLVSDWYSLSFLISQSPLLIASFSFYILFSSHLYPPCAGPMVGLDTCPIRTFHKSSCSNCKAENYCSSIISTLMRSES